jgi:hypothetical protein
LPNAKICDGSQPPVTFDWFEGRAAGSGWLHRQVELSRCAANTLPHHSTYAIHSQMTAALLSRTLAASSFSEGKFAVALLSVEFLTEVW